MYKAAALLVRLPSTIDIHVRVTRGWGVQDSLQYFDCYWCTEIREPQTMISKRSDIDKTHNTWKPIRYPFLDRCHENDEKVREEDDWGDKIG